jgi:predicted Zn-ribbon and HTH transcriptional regulator
MSSGERPPGAEAREPSNAGAVSEPAGDRSDGGAADDGGAAGEGGGDPPDDVARYERFKKVDGARYDRVNDFLRDRTHITAREWAIARLCADFRTETGVEMTKIGEHLPELVPFMTDTYTPQAVNQARASFEEKVRMAGATFLYGAMCDFFTAEELDDVIYEATETAKFLLEVEGVDLTVEEELAAEDRISDVMREVRAASEALRNGPVECPDCGHTFGEETVE